MDITQARDGSMMVIGQRLYRPEDVQKILGGTGLLRDARELFYTVEREEVAAESVMHRCVVHFLPSNRQFPSRKEHPGFVVQKVYDIEQKQILKLTDQGFNEKKWVEADFLVQRTLVRLGDIPCIETEDSAANQEHQWKRNREVRRKNQPSFDFSGQDAMKFTKPLEVESTKSCVELASDYYTILVKFKALTGETERDTWLERLLQGIQFTCMSMDSVHSDNKDKGRSDDFSHAGNLKDGRSFLWPDSAVLVVTALERASYYALGSNAQKYSQKMEQIVFNLQNNARLAQRLLNKELEPSEILNMSYNELKAL